VTAKAKFHFASLFEAGSKLVGDQLRTSFEPDSVMEFQFGFNETFRSLRVHCPAKRHNRGITQMPQKLSRRDLNGHDAAAAAVRRHGQLTEASPLFARRRTGCGDKCHVEPNYFHYTI